MSRVEGEMRGGGDALLEGIVKLRGDLWNKWVTRRCIYILYIDLVRLGLIYMDFIRDLFKYQVH